METLKRLFPQQRHFGGEDGDGDGDGTAAAAAAATALARFPSDETRETHGGDSARDEGPRERERARTVSLLARATRQVARG